VRETLAGSAATLSYALHPDLDLIDEPVGDLAQLDHSASDSAGSLPQCEGTGGKDQSVGACRKYTARPFAWAAPTVPSSPKSSDYTNVFPGLGSSRLLKNWAGRAISDLVCVISECWAFWGWFFALPSAPGGRFSTMQRHFGPDLLRSNCSGHKISHAHQVVGGARKAEHSIDLQCSPQEPLAAHRAQHLQKLRTQQLLRRNRDKLAIIPPGNRFDSCVLNTAVLTRYGSKPFC